MFIHKKDLLEKAIAEYGFDASTLCIQKELNPNNSHGDIHYQIRVNERLYSARFIAEQRYESEAFVKLSGEVIKEQIQFSQYLRNSGIPFMRHVPTGFGEAYVVLNELDGVWRFVLFEWMQGTHITCCTVEVAERFGAFARNLHDISSTYETVTLPKESHMKGYNQFYKLLQNYVEATPLSPTTINLLKQYFQQIEYHLDQAKTETYDFIVQSDLNPLNILWNKAVEITGVVDFESITYTDRVEGLAWLVKWYSRTDGVSSHNMSPVLARAILRGYRAEELLTTKELKRLPSLLWLTGCLNWNFTASTVEILKKNDEFLLEDHLNKYIKRGNTLLSLL
ncbi:phosphotransferase [Bacillus carboniphilus]|uniref:Phosphotransferase n=1 Tax=Bacillus carboniphilus TaxID=86663 RepID=A0ABN0WHX5_9BACI